MSGQMEGGRAAGALAPSGGCIDGPAEACGTPDSTEEANRAMQESSAQRCAAFMKSSPPPKLNSLPETQFWPESAAGLHHENLLKQCVELWAGVQTSGSEEKHLAVARASAKLFFERCLASMSRRRMSDFESKLYCFDVYIVPYSVPGGRTGGYWAYQVYRTAADKDPERFRIVARAFCEETGANEACRDDAQMRPLATTSRAARQPQRKGAGASR